MEAVQISPLDIQSTILFSFSLCRSITPFLSLAIHPHSTLSAFFYSHTHLSPAALGVQQPSLLGASPSMYSQQSALAAASLNSQSAAANYQLSQQTSALQQQAAAAAAAALQQVNYTRISRAVFS